MFSQPPKLRKSKSTRIRPCAAIDPSSRSASCATSSAASFAGITTLSALSESVSIVIVRRRFPARMDEPARRSNAPMPGAVSRGILVLITLLVAILFYVPIGHVDFAENWGEGTFGITLPAREGIVVAVDRGSAADRAGVRPGDRIAGRWNYEIASRVRAPYAGERETVTFERSGRPYSVTLVAGPNKEFGIVQRIGGILAYIPPTVFLV